MAFCAQCGSQAQGSFCPNCGAKVSSGAGTTRTATSGQLDENIVCAACYLLWAVTGVLFLVLEPYNRNRLVKFHALQSILTAVALFAGFGALSVLAFLPLIGLLFSLVTLVYPLVGFGLWLFLMYKAYNKERWEVPVIGPLATSLANK